MRLLFLAGLIAPSVIVPAQEKSSPQHNLELNLIPGKLHKGIPSEFTFELVNISAHDVRVPKPAVDCHGGVDGEIWLRIDFIASQHGNVGSVYDCWGDSLGVPPVMRPVLDWQLLHPGQRLKLTLNQHTLHHKLHYDDGAAGRYEFWAEYDPPTVNLNDQKTLRQKGIDFPHDPLKTRHLIYKRR